MSEAERAILRHAPVFAALGEPTRLALVETLSDGRGRSITALTEGAGMSRQAVTKHLRTLEAAGLVQAAKDGRSTVYALRPEPMDAARAHLERVGRQWDAALARLAAFVDGPKA
ncbi:ArsR/SmtB family transcription factor [Algicella marina]|uniref:Metalloregulator ArsR/SmtB family transcription factor n=1 Tax=Algicella marina TaxID=2683284 RepID=A0A6P1T1E0_9RHOB|nr:metalloregulator ArsR/SmtB family transcription factor [Algicella marina]QHQ35630.1 metalloregulator ArsR/SmtB family transcription factor [Algicella marina]